MDGAISPPIIVTPSAIESTLNKIWETLASKEGGAKMRACLFNLILVTKNTPRAAYIRGVAQRVIEKFPSRILFITIEKGQKEEIFRTAVSVVEASGGMSDVACDLIEFSVTEESAMRIPFGVLPHLITDLPIYLLWAEDPIQENPLSYQLDKLTQRLIFDSEATDNLVLFARSLLHHQKTSLCDIADLNWARTENWRTLLISTFHSLDRLKELSDAALIKIAFNALQTTFFCHTQIQSVYVQGWLACQLGWQFVDLRAHQNTIIFRYTSAQGQPISIELIPTVTNDLAPGAIINFTLTTHGEEHFEFTRNPKVPQEVILHLCSKEKCEMPSHFVLAKGSIGLTLVKEICRKGTSAHYLRILEFLANMDPQRIW